LSAGANWQHENFRFKPGSSRLGGTQANGDDPDYQFSLRSSVNIGPAVTFDAALRSIDALPNPGVPAYTELNARIAWNITKQLELSLSGFNLIHPQHIEFTQVPASVEVPRSYLVNAKYRF
jgi:iron complex outermembrane receptor protein